MASRKDQFLTKSAKTVIDMIYESTDLNIKEIMSGGVLAFADLSREKQYEYVAKAKMGGNKGYSTQFYMLTEYEQKLVNEARQAAEAKLAESADLAAEIVDNAADDAKAKPKNKGRRTG